MARDVQLLPPRGTKWLFVSTIFCRNFTNLLFEFLKLHLRRERSARGPMITNRTTIRPAPCDWQLRNGTR